MLGFKFQQCHYYSYNNLNELLQQLQNDKFGDTQIDQEQQMIEYFIDRSRCLRLYDLIYSIKVKFIKFHLGQLLVLFKEILEKIIEMEKLQLEHDYLDQTRIWITLEQKSPPLNIIYQKIQYKINFTGYQCKLYEINMDETLKASEKILIIISNILRDFKASEITCTNDNNNLQEIINEIYEPIIQQCLKRKINETITVINHLLNQYQFENKSQTISFDDKYFDFYTNTIRSIRMNDVEQELNDCIQNYGQYGEELESILLLKVKSIGQNLDNFFNKKIENQEIDKLLDEKKKNTQENNEQLIFFIQTLSNFSIENNLKEYKFEISPAEEKQFQITFKLEQEIKKYLNIFKTFLLFQSKIDARFRIILG
ncbi:unnamed protein product [Paramecium sonneborni]|uniref:Uncharacterized protein n=1 Tax=Paramecium sonneborni TaxID=65129 RepID=A0A8S1NCL2_9CILI|nr:unnamed protein product [Paramecium sonneborni]